MPLPGMCIAGMMVSAGVVEPSPSSSASLLTTGVSFTVDGGIGGTATASGVDFGDAAESRRIVVVTTANGSGNDVATATIGGVAATIHQQAGHSGGATGLHVAILSAIVPTGTSGDIVITESSGTARRATVFRLVRFSVLDGGTDEAAVTTAALSKALASVADGVVIAGYVGSTGTVDTAVTWSSATEVYDVGDNVRHSVAWNSSPGTGLTVGATQGSINNAGCDLAVVSFEPF